jgi:hypothetical protein
VFVCDRESTGAVRRFAILSDLPLPSPQHSQLRCFSCNAFPPRCVFVMSCHHVTRLRILLTIRTADNVVYISLVSFLSLFLPSLCFPRPTGAGLSPVSQTGTYDRLICVGRPTSFPPFPPSATKKTTHAESTTPSRAFASDSHPLHSFIPPLTTNASQLQIRLMPADSAFIFTRSLLHLQPLLS